MKVTVICIGNSFDIALQPRGVPGLPVPPIPTPYPPPTFTAPYPYPYPTPSTPYPTYSNFLAPPPIMPYSLPRGNLVPLIPASQSLPVPTMAMMSAPPSRVSLDIEECLVLRK